MGQRAPETPSFFSNDPDPLENTGQSVLGLLDRAAGMAEKNIQHAAGVAQKLLQELQSAEQRIKELEADVLHYRDKADRAEKWLRHISLQIEQRFFGATNQPSQQASMRQTSPLDSAPRKQRLSSPAY